jgi:flagellin
MGMGVVTNVSALTAHRTLAQTDRATSRSLERLSSGYRINRAADDAAGLAISEGLRAQVGGMTRAVRNSQDGISVVQTAEGALGETTAVLQRMRDLAVQAANAGALGAVGTAAVQTEVDQLRRELDRIAATTSFNGRPLLDGSFLGTFQVGANVGETLTLSLGRPGYGMDTVGLGVDSVDVTRTVSLPTTQARAVSAAEGTPAPGRLSIAGDFVTPGAYPASFAALAGTVSYGGRSFDLASVDYTGATTATDHISRLDTAAIAALGTSFVPFVGTASELVFSAPTPGAGSSAADAAAMTPSYRGASGAVGAIPLIDEAIARVSTTRAELGAAQNRLEHTIARLTVSIENTTAAESRIRDADMAAEMTTFTRNQVMTQAGTAMLAQATRTPQSLLKLLG